MTKINGQSVLICISLSFKFPYHANVMNTLEQQRRRIVKIPAFIFRCQVLGVRFQVSGFRFQELGVSFLVNGVKIPCFHYSLFTR